MFRGNLSATIDERGRIRIPSGFLDLLREKYGDELFITSITGDYLKLYPMKVWEEIEEKLLKIPSMNTSRAKLLGRLTYFGSSIRLDKAGRILIPQRLRTAASLSDEVAVLGYLDCLEIWAPERFLEHMQDEPLTKEDFALLSDLGV